MTDSGMERSLIEAMAKHLPPSAASLRLVDVGGQAAEILLELRPDVDVILSPGTNDGWLVKPDSIDAVVAYGAAPVDNLLEAALMALRPGGRLIILDLQAQPSEGLVKLLEDGGYTRILVEPGAEHPAPLGVLMRGEKPHTEERTVDRAKQVARRDSAARGVRYIHVLIQQTPNKPAWKLEAGEKVDWQAVAVVGQGETVLLAFSSLPKAVEFMQPAVMAGHVKDVNKIAKFRWEVARDWPFPIMLNPSDEIFDTQAVALLAVDPRTAEAPDE
jgi:hypothetical protein